MSSDDEELAVLQASRESAKSNLRLIHATAKREAAKSSRPILNEDHFGALQVLGKKLLETHSALTVLSDDMSKIQQFDDKWKEIIQAHTRMMKVRDAAAATAKEVHDKAVADADAALIRGLADVEKKYQEALDVKNKGSLPASKMQEVIEILDDDDEMSGVTRAVSAGRHTTQPEKSKRQREDHDNRPGSKKPASSVSARRIDTMRVDDDPLRSASWRTAFPMSVDDDDASDEGEASSSLPARDILSDDDISDYLKTAALPSIRNAVDTAMDTGSDNPDEEMLMERLESIHVNAQQQCSDLADFEVGKDELSEKVLFYLDQYISMGNPAFVVLKDEIATILSRQMHQDEIENSFDEHSRVWNEDNDYETIQDICSSNFSRDIPLAVRRVVVPALETTFHAYVFLKQGQSNATLLDSIQRSPKNIFDAWSLLSQNYGKSGVLGAIMQDVDLALQNKNMTALHVMYPNTTLPTLKSLAIQPGDDQRQWLVLECARQQNDKVFEDAFDMYMYEDEEKREFNSIVEQVRKTLFPSLTNTDTIDDLLKLSLIPYAVKNDVDIQDTKTAYEIYEASTELNRLYEVVGSKLPPLLAVLASKQGGSGTASKQGSSGTAPKRTTQKKTAVRGRKRIQIAFRSLLHAVWAANLNTDEALLEYLWNQTSFSSRVRKNDHAWNTMRTQLSSLKIDKTSEEKQNALFETFWKKVKELLNVSEDRSESLSNVFGSPKPWFETKYSVGSSGTNADRSGEPPAAYAQVDHDTESDASEAED